MWTFDFPWPATDTTGRGALQHDSKEPIPITERVPDINRIVARTIMQCIAPDPNNRPQSAEAILKQLKTATGDTQ
jgi:hypothetical protein